MPVELNVDNMPLLKEESFSAIFAGFIWEEHVETHTKKQPIDLFGTRLHSA